MQNRRSFHEGKPNLKSTLGHKKTFQAVLFGEESTNGTFRLGFFNLLRLWLTKQSNYFRVVHPPCGTFFIRFRIALEFSVKWFWGKWENQSARSKNTPSKGEHQQYTRFS